MSLKLPRVKCRQLVQALKRAGFEEQRQRGSHLHMRRVSDGKRVTVPIPPGTLRAILRDADISVDELLEFLQAAALVASSAVSLPFEHDPSHKRKVTLPIVWNTPSIPGAMRSLLAASHQD